MIWRYLLPGVGGRLTLLIAAIGCAGVMIGVASLVLVVSFMNGAEARLAGQIASADGHIFIGGRGLGDPGALTSRLRHIPGVASASSSLEATAIVTAAGRSFNAELEGSTPDAIVSSPLFQRHTVFIVGTAPTRSGTVALGSELATRLGVGPSSHVAITLPRVDRDGLRIENFDARVTAVVSTDVDAFDSRRVLMPFADLRRILGTTGATKRINLRLRDIDEEASVLAAARRMLPHGTRITTWRDMNAALFDGLAQERLAMTAIISLVTLIALSNVLSSMVMLVRHKAREIAILRTLGMSRWSIAKVFVGVGAAIGLAGETAGLALGFGLKAAKDPLTLGLRATMARPPVEFDALLSLPLAISSRETVSIMVLVGLGVLLSTVYPALRAAAVDAAHVLRYT